MRTCLGIISRGVGGTIITIECHTSNSLPTIIIVGSANKTVTEARHRLRGAFVHSSLRLPKKRITLNLAPADTPKAESSLDLAMATTILLLGEQNTNLAHDAVAIGELGLDGSVKPVRGIIGKLAAGSAQGLSTFIIPVKNMPQATLVPNITLLPVHNLSEVALHVAGVTTISPFHTTDGESLGLPAIKPGDELDAISGHDEAKRILAIAAAGGHHVLLYGPPGTGKSMLAKGLSSLLPPLERIAALEATQLHSLASRSFSQLIRHAPVRSPHHSTPVSAMLGGGPHMRPGEISLSHNGVLVLDELPEFNQRVIESLRQPLEERTVTITHAKDSVRLPAAFTLVATANPCPCGYAGHNTVLCRCSAVQLHRYRAKLSGPFMDRVDLCYEMPATNHGELLSANNSIPSSLLRKSVHTARLRQAGRFGNQTDLNGAIHAPKTIRQYRLEPAAKALLENAAVTLSLSARGTLRSLAVARTIADMEDRPEVSEAHLAEALRYRPQSDRV